MPGLINSPPAIQNPLLRQAEAAVEASVGTGKSREDYLKVVVAGMRAGLANGPQSMMGNLRGRSDPVHDCAIGAVNLVLYLRRIAKGTMPPAAMISAATTLMYEALDFTDQAGIAKIGKEELVRAVHIFTNSICKAFGITPDMLNRAAGLVHGVTQDPAKLAQIQSQLPQGEA